MLIGDALGQIEVSPQHAAAYISGWFSADDQVSLVGMRVGHIPAGSSKVLSMTVTARELVQMLRSPDGSDTLQRLTLSEDGTQWNLYVGVGAVKNAVEGAGRQTNNNVATMPGVWLDIDCKPGSFTNEEEIVQWLRTFGVVPTMIVTTGSGGVHAYWKTTTPLSVEQAMVLQRAWWALAREEAGTRSIDKLVDTARILRIPGSVRWNKDGEGFGPRPVRIFFRDLKYTYPPEYLWEKARAASEAYDAEVEASRVHNKSVLRGAHSGDGSLTVEERFMLYEATEWFDKNVDWAQILEPVGWTYLRTEYNGCRQWNRPGGSGKSAVTDYKAISGSIYDSMSLLSSAEDSGLFDLKEAGVRLDKWRVSLRLNFQDNVHAALAWMKVAMQPS